MNILVLSGSDHIRFPTMINQKAYADRHGYQYNFDITPRAGRDSPYYHKLFAISNALPSTDWLFWIDDDAAFTQLNISFESLVPELQRDDISVIFCASPVNPAGGWTHISSGNFFVRNDDCGRKLIKRAILTDLTMTERWWDENKLGIFTNTDQDALVFHILEDNHIKDRTKIIEYTRFNTRPYHFDFANQHFLVHFTHRPETTKEAQMLDFCARFNLNHFFLSEPDALPYASYSDPQLRNIPWLTA